MCLVEIEKAPKLQIACSTQVAEGMVVHTQSAQAKSARTGVLELLLINHPLDCPICDQAGECELQDFTFQEGRPASRFSPIRQAFQPGRGLRRPTSCTCRIAASCVRAACASWRMSRRSRCSTSRSEATGPTSASIPKRGSIIPGPATWWTSARGLAPLQGLPAQGPRVGAGQDRLRLHRLLAGVQRDARYA